MLYMVKIVKEREYVTTGKLAEMLGVSRYTVLRWIKEGRIKAYKTLGGIHLIPIDEAKRIIAKIMGGEKHGEG